MIPRWLHHLYAHILGYFWLPCPLCGKMFGGHETKESWIYDFPSGMCVCSDCTAEAKRRNEQVYGQDEISAGLVKRGVL